MTSPTDLPGMPPVPAPLTFQRLAATLGEGWEPDVEAATLRRRVGAAAVAASLLTTEGVVLLCSATRIGPEIPLSRRRDVETFVNDWHRERIWPTVVLDAGPTEVVVQTRVAVDASAGLTDTQLGEYLRIGVGTAQQCFAALTETGLAPPEPDGPDAG